jgi:hypothetical protein
MEYFSLSSLIIYAHSYIYFFRRHGYTGNNKERNVAGKTLRRIP